MGQEISCFKGVELGYHDSLPLLGHTNGDTQFYITTYHSTRAKNVALLPPEDDCKS